MLNEMMLLQGFAFGGTLGNILAQWEQIGVFSYGLPFLLIFALVFGILSRVGIFGENKPINAVIALSVSLLSLQFGFVSLFFSQIFPKVGIGLSVVLALLILAGLFMDTAATPLLFFIGIIVFVIILASSFDLEAGGLWFFLSQNLGSIIFIAIGILILIMVVRPSFGNNQNRQEHDNILAKSIKSAFGGGK